MGTSRGTLDWQPLAQHLDLVAPSVAEAASTVPDALVAPVDEQLSDTAEFCAAYDVDLQASVNCVIVMARRGERTTFAAVLVRGTDRADVNSTVRKHLDARKITFADQGHVEAATGMRAGGITPVGLPTDWPILVDGAVVGAGDVVIGGGVRSSKLLVTGDALADLPGAEVLGLVVR